MSRKGVRVVPTWREITTTEIWHDPGADVPMEILPVGSYERRGGYASQNVRRALD